MAGATGPDSFRQVNGMGTGVVIDPRGYVITNYHVVEDVDDIRVTLHSGETTSADLIASRICTTVRLHEVFRQAQQSAIVRGAHAVLEGTMSPGLLGQFLLFSVMAAGSLGALSEVWGELSQAAGAAERLSELLATKPKVAAPENPIALPVPAQGALQFDKVSFSYPTRPDLPIVENLSLNVKPGETVALVGSSGSGKSTLLNLALRYYDPTKGTVKLDGVDLSKAAPQVQ